MTLLSAHIQFLVCAPPSSVIHFVFMHLFFLNKIHVLYQAKQAWTMSCSHRIL